MNKNFIWIGGILAALAVGGLIAWAGSRGGAIWLGYPVFAVGCAIAFLIQWVMFVPAFVYQTEKYFDLAGSLTYISLVLFAWTVVGVDDDRRLLIGALVIIWAARLGSFLFQRVMMTGEDKRFRSIKPDFLQFFMTWTIQGLWVSITLGAGLAAMTSADPQPVGVFAAVGALLWMAGFIIEVVADGQKSRFKAEPTNEGRFIDVGLWRWSRHPNYFGEILLWCGIAIIALPVLQGWQYATLVSPLFVAFLLIYISGVRMLEHRADRKWGDDPAYLAYKASTPVLIPRPPG